MEEKKQNVASVLIVIILFIVALIGVIGAGTIIYKMVKQKSSKKIWIQIIYLEMSNITSIIYYITLDKKDTYKVVTILAEIGCVCFML